MKRILLAAAIVAPSLLTGCSSLGMGKSEFSCKAPDGVSCQSVSGVYANAIDNNLPSQHEGAQIVKNEHYFDSDEVGGFEIKDEGDKKVINKVRGKLVKPPSMVNYQGQEILKNEKVMRITVFPWKDEDKVLHDKSYVYMIVEDSEWKKPHTTEGSKTPYFGKTFGIGVK